MRRRFLLFAPLAIVGFGVFIALGGLAVQLLWNWLLPPLFGVAQLTFWQALGVLALSRILFGGFGHHRGPGFGMRDRWGRMTPEERERFRQGMRARCGFQRPDRDPGTTSGPVQA